MGDDWCQWDVFTRVAAPVRAAVAQADREWRGFVETAADMACTLVCDSPFVRMTVSTAFLSTIGCRRPFGDAWVRPTRTPGKESESRRMYL